MALDALIFLGRFIDSRKKVDSAFFSTRPFKIGMWNFVLMRTIVKPSKLLKNKVVSLLSSLRLDEFIVFHVKTSHKLEKHVLWFLNMQVTR